MTIQEILDYIAKTPENANVNVLSGMLDELTSGGGEEGGGDITVEALSVTENGTYTAESGKAYSPVTVNVPSDFSIAHVTFINSDDTKMYTVNKLAMIQESYMEVGSVSVNSSQAVDLVLYKGSTYVSEFEDIDYDTPPVVTGNISFDADAGVFVITGDGSITRKGVGTMS